MRTIRVTRRRDAEKVPNGFIAVVVSELGLTTTGNSEAEALANLIREHNLNVDEFDVQYGWTVIATIV